MTKNWMVTIALTAMLGMTCIQVTPSGNMPNRQTGIPTPGRSQVQMNDQEPPASLIDPAEKAPYDEGYSQMREEAERDRQLAG